MTRPDHALIPRSILFGNPVKALPDISPDGRRLAYLAPSPEGVLNVWVRTIGLEDDVQVTRDAYRGIRTYFWAEDDRHLLYVQDEGGDENFHVHAVDIETGAIRDLTPHPGVKAENVLLARRYPGEILVGLNRRTPEVFDMYRVTIATGEAVLEAENPGDVIGYVADAEFRVRGAMSMHPEDGHTELRVRGADGTFRTLLEWPFGDEGQPVTFSADGRSVVVTTTLGADTARLVRVDVETGAELETLAEDPRTDVEHVLVNPDTFAIEAVEFDYQRSEWTILDSAVAADFAALAAVQRGEIGVVSRDRADRQWIVAFNADDGPIAWYLYARDTRTATLLFVNQPELARYPLVRIEPVLVGARDGLTLPCYLTRPRTDGPGPLVLLVHGGPWARDTWGYDPVSQWLANRGYAVLKVNFRGSTGFGKRFVSAGDREWGVGAMQHDLTDAVRWAIAEGIADPARIAIMGGSYGGYATLAGLTFTPELYACGVDIVGPSHIRTLLASIPPYWAPMKQIFVRRVGDIDGDEDFNRRISPLFHAERIRVPLIIAQGANDPRVNIAESDQMVGEMRARDLPVTYVVYPDEGHGMARPNNRLDFYGRVEEFLAEHLGGAAEPWEHVPGTSAELR